MYYASLKQAELEDKVPSQKKRRRSTASTQLCTIVFFILSSIPVQLAQPLSARRRCRFQILIVLLVQSCGEFWKSEEY